MGGPFTSGWTYIRFCEIVRGNYRFAYPAFVSDFLQALVDTSESRIKELPEGFPLWRAQLGCETTEREVNDPGFAYISEDNVPHRAERMKPRRNAACEGRANPKGIPCLYTSTDRNTAMSEIRPWMGATISLGRFSTTKQLRLVDLTLGHDFKLTPDHLFGLVSPDEIQKGVWAQVDRAFSTPVTDDPATAEYVPTQVIAEFFRRAGHDGLVYRSALSDGFNIALFDLDSAQLIDCQLMKADKISFAFSERS
jgi:hypothetical protein